MFRIALVLSAVGVSASAHAHGGHHGALSASGLGLHLLEWDHLAWMLVVLGTAAVAFRAGRSVEARCVAKREQKQ